MHVLPRVAELEERFAQELVVLGVHAGKFAEERRTPNIRQACLRLGVRHPVVNDRHFRVWRAYAANAWPTVALVSPDGYLIGEQAGEFDVAAMTDVVARAVSDSEARGTLRRGRADFGTDPEAPREPQGVLRFPTRVLSAGDRLFVSDAGHARVLELQLDARGGAKVERVFGDGVAGLRDGDAARARFREPQGLALSGTSLFVADRASHAVRRVSLADGTVSTIAGTGELGAYRIPEGHAPRETALRSPWGLALEGTTLLIAMAGSHQVWSLDISNPEAPMRLIAGTGAEDVADGAARDAALAQTSGLAAADGRLFLADAESSSVRVLETGGQAEVRTLVGTGLFEFGDRDGAGDDALLQHDLDLAVSGSTLLVADTYNSKLKLVDPATRRCRTLPGEAGSGEALREPSGVWAGPEGVFVADTGHHRIVRVEPSTGALSEIPVAIATVVEG